MKSLFAILLLGFSVKALADENLTYVWPSVSGLAVNQACATETTFRSLEPISFCTETRVDRFSCPKGPSTNCRPLKPGQAAASNETLKEEVTCIAYGQRRLEVSRLVTTEKCLENAPTDEMNHGQCLKWGSVDTVIGLDFSVAVYRKMSADHGSDFVGYQKYTVPYCQ